MAPRQNESDFIKEYEEVLCLLGLSAALPDYHTKALTKIVDFLSSIPDPSKLEEQDRAIKGLMHRLKKADSEAGRLHMANDFLKCELERHNKVIANCNEEINLANLKLLESRLRGEQNLP
jgi:hypothetical protein